MSKTDESVPIPLALTDKERSTLERIELKRRDVNWYVARDLIELGLVNSNINGLHITDEGRRLLGFVRCDGEAHSNPHIDNCLTCAPRWGWIKP